MTELAPFCEICRHNHVQGVKCSVCGHAGRANIYKKMRVSDAIFFVKYRNQRIYLNLIRSALVPVEKLNWSISTLLADRQSYLG
jgi:hypothetical protein